MVYNGILMETIGISVMVFIVLLLFFLAPFTPQLVLVLSFIVIFPQICST